MDVVAVVAALVIATVLWAGAIAKLVRPDAIRLTLIAVGVPVRHSNTTVFVLIAAEACGALLLLLAPRSPVSLAAVLALFTAFALAGAAALRARTSIRCACFGYGDKPLGWRQLVQLPVVAAIASVVVSEASWTAQEGLAMTAAVLLGIAAWWAVRTWGTWQATRAMRVSLREASMASNALDLEVEIRG